MRYRRPLIATDLGDGNVIRPLVRDFDPEARVVVLTTYRIPYSGLRLLLDAPRLRLALEERSREALDAFVACSGLDASRLESVCRYGDARTALLIETRERPVDLVVLAYTHQSAWATRRLAKRVGECGAHVLIVERQKYPARADDALVPPGPW
jgi:hypothetical protein